MRSNASSMAAVRNTGRARRRHGRRPTLASQCQEGQRRHGFDRVELKVRREEREVQPSVLVQGMRTVLQQSGLGWMNFPQAYDGAYRGSPLADVSMFSCGPIKTMTAFGGAVIVVCDRDALVRMRRRQAGYRPPIARPLCTAPAETDSSKRRSRLDLRIVGGGSSPTWSGHSRGCSYDAPTVPTHL